VGVAGPEQQVGEVSGRLYGRWNAIKTGMEFAINYSTNSPTRSYFWRFCGRGWRRGIDGGT